MRSRFLLAIGAIVFALALAEGGVRALDRYRCLMGFSGNFWEPNTLYGWAHTPGAFGWAKRCFGEHVEWETFTRINSAGLRDREVPYARTDALRVLVLGDSYTEGMQVPMDETFSRHLEERLRDDIGRPVEVINAGCSGYGTDNALMYYRTEGRKYRPDLVLLAFNTGNDVSENYDPLMRAIGFPYARKPHFLIEQGRLVLHDFPVPAGPRNVALRESVKRSLWRHSALYRLIVTFGLPRIAPAAVAAEQPTAKTNILGALRRDAEPIWRDAEAVSRALLRRMRHDVERDGAQFVVVVLTSPWEVSEDRLSRMLALPGLTASPADYDSERASRRMLEALRRARISHIGLLDGFRAHLKATGVTGYFEFDQHWTVAGHALAAELIERGLRTQGVVTVSHPTLGARRPGALQAPGS